MGTQAVASYYVPHATASIVFLHVKSKRQTMKHKEFWHLKFGNIPFYIHIPVSRGYL